MIESPPPGSLAAAVEELDRRRRALREAVLDEVEPIVRGAIRLVWRLTDSETPASRERRRGR